MFKFIKVWTTSKNENAKSFKRNLAKELNGRQLKYVTERISDEEHVIGRAGALIRKGDELLVMASEKVVFRGKIDLLQMNPLLSLEGIILTGSDLENSGRERSVIAYYTYYRKVN